MRKCLERRIYKEIFINFSVAKFKGTDTSNGRYSHDSKYWRGGRALRIVTSQSCSKSQVPATVDHAHAMDCIANQRTSPRRNI